MPCPCCNPTGTCCEFFCIFCRACEYQWDGTQYDLVNESGDVTCPTTDCPECPPTAAGIPAPFGPITDYIEGIEFITWSPCCPYPDSYYICTDTTEGGCSGGYWAEGTCDGTEEEVQSLCEGLFP